MADFFGSSKGSSKLDTWRSGAITPRTVVALKGEDVRDEAHSGNTQ